MIGSDDIGFNPGTGTFATPDVGNGISVLASGDILPEADAGNYTLLGQPSGLSADITAATLTITGVNALDKVYDTTTLAELTDGRLNGIFGSDRVTLNQGTGNFATSNVGNDIAVTARRLRITRSGFRELRLCSSAGQLQRRHHRRDPHDHRSERLGQSLRRNHSRLAHRRKLEWHSRLRHIDSHRRNRSVFR